MFGGGTRGIVGADDEEEVARGVEVVVLHCGHADALRLTRIYRSGRARQGRHCTLTICTAEQTRQGRAYVSDLSQWVKKRIEARGGLRQG